MTRIASCLILSLVASGSLMAGNGPGRLPAVSAEVEAKANGDQNVIVVYDDDDDDDGKGREGRLLNWGARDIQHHRYIKSARMRIGRNALDQLKKDKKVKYIAPDRQVGATAAADFKLSTVRGIIGLPRDTPGTYTGKGIGVAVIDSGIYRGPAFDDAGYMCGKSRIVYSENFVKDTASISDDPYGHGTHVASILSNNATCDPQNLTMNGVAPDVRIINLRVLDKDGKGSDSAVIAAIDRAIELKSTYNIRVINLSLGRQVEESFQVDPLCQAAERAWKAGIVVVVAAGNNGRDNSRNTQGYATITSPANDPYVITVGAVRAPSAALADVRTDDTIATYSSRGPSLLDHVVKPDLVAPGNLVVARINSTSTLSKKFPENQVSVDFSSYFRLSGTSMAAPVVSGAVALLLQKSSTLTPDQIKARLMKTAWKGFVPTASIVDAKEKKTYNVQHDIFTVGAGYLDIGAALVSNEKIGSTQSARSPGAVISNGKVTLTNVYPGMSSSGIVWGDGIAWGTGIVWGDSVVQSSGIVWGDTAVWGANVSSGFTVIWSDGIVWGDSSPFSESLEGCGDLN